MRRLGHALGFVLLVNVVLPKIGLGSVERIVQLGRHLDAPLLPAPTLALVGNSITREGVDTRLVEEAAPQGWHAQNLAISGCGLSEVRLLLPKVLAARPAAVAISIRPEDMGRVDDPNIDKAFAYAMGGFVSAWPADWTRADLPGVSEEIYKVLRSTRFQQELHFRTAPLNVLSQEVRLRFHSGLRQTAPNNWTDPYEVEFDLAGGRLEKHIDAIRRHTEVLLAGKDRTGAELIHCFATDIHRAGATPILIILPLHPLLRDGLEPAIATLAALVEEVAREESGKVIDASDVLSAHEFADAQHPNAAGRAVYSRFLGQELRLLTSMAYWLPQYQSRPRGRPPAQSPRPPSQRLGSSTTDSVCGPATPTNVPGQYSTGP